MQLQRSSKLSAGKSKLLAEHGRWYSLAEDAQPLLSLDCLQTLANICNGTNDILKDMTETVEIFAIEDKKDTRKAK